MKDPNDSATLSLIDSERKQAFCDFIGANAFEDDGGWSYEVWSAAWNAAMKRAEKTFRSFDTVPYYGSEVADILKSYTKNDV